MQKKQLLRKENAIAMHAERARSMTARFIYSRVMSKSQPTNMKISVTTLGVKRKKLIFKSTDCWSTV